MTIGYTTSGTGLCVDTALNSNKAWCSQLPPGGGATVTTCNPANCTATGCTVTYKPSGTAVNTTVTLSPTSCTIPEPVVDATTFYALAFSALAVIWAAKMVYNSLAREVA